jgi:RNA polymerase sigma factor for flagellar operon FliA
MNEDQVIKENYGLAVSLSLAFHKPGSGYEVDDLIQTALISMLKAHRKFNSDKSVFSTFATHCIKNDLIKFLKKNKPLKLELFEKEHSKPIDIDDVLPDNLNTLELGIFYYKKCGYKDKEIRDILDLTINEYKKYTRSCHKKILIANA